MRVQVRDFGYSIKSTSSSCDVGKVSLANSFACTNANGLTVSFWYQTPTFAGQTIAQFYINSGTLDAFRITIENSTGKLFLWAVDTGGTGHLICKAASTAIQIGKWHHITFTGLYNGSDSITGNIYVDGVLVVSGTSSGHDVRVSDSFRMKAGTGDHYFDNVTCWGRVLAAAEVAAMYANGFDVLAARDTNLQFRWLFNEGSGSTSADQSVNGNTATISAAGFSSYTPTQARQTRSTSVPIPVHNDLLAAYNGKMNINPSSFVAYTTTDGRWIDGTAAGSASMTASKWYLNYSTGTVTGRAGFDPNVLFNGKPALRVEVLSTAVTGVTLGVAALLGVGISPSVSVQKTNFIPIKPNTQYKLSGWIKGSNLSSDGGSGGRVRLLSYNGTATNSQTAINTNYFLGTFDWTYFEVVGVVNSVSAFANIWVQIDTTNNGAGTMWVSGLKLEEMANARQKVYGTLGPKNNRFDSYPTFTAAQTTSGRWIDGTAVGINSPTQPFNLNWAFFSKTGTGEVQYDTTVYKILGAETTPASLKLRTTAAGSNIEVCCYASSSAASVRDMAIPVTPSTTYYWECWVKTNYVSGDATSAFQIQFLERLGDNTNPATQTVLTGLKTTQDWIKYSGTFTTGSTTTFLQPRIRIAGNDGSATLIMDAWVDGFVLRPNTEYTRTLA